MLSKAAHFVCVYVCVCMRHAVSFAQTIADFSTGNGKYLRAVATNCNRTPLICVCACLCVCVCNCVQNTRSGTLSGCFYISVRLRSSSKHGYPPPLAHTLTHTLILLCGYNEYFTFALNVALISLQLLRNNGHFRSLLLSHRTA